MSREKLKDFLGGGKDSISYIVKDFNPVPGDPSRLDPGIDDLGKDPGTGKQLIGHNTDQEPQAEPGQALINDFTNYLTDLQNYFPVRGGTTPSQPLSRVDRYGENIFLEEAGADDKHVYLDPNETDDAGLGATLSQYSESTYETGNPEIVKKAGKPNHVQDANVGVGASRVSGQALLKNIKGRDMSSVGPTFRPDVQADGRQLSMQAVQSMLGSRNRFNPTDEIAFAPYDTSGLEGKIEAGTDGMGTSSVQTGYGEYDKDMGNQANLVISDDLKKVARSMILSAIGVGGIGTIGSSDPDTFSPDSDLSTIIEKDVAGNRTSKEKAPRAESSFGSPLPSILQVPIGQSMPDRGAFEVGGKRSSYGQTYSSEMPYSGGSTTVTRARAAAVIISMLSLCAKLESTLDGFLYDKNVPFGTRSPKVAGQFTCFGAASHIQMFRRYIVPVTRYPLGECIEMGAKAMFQKSIFTASESGAGYEAVSDGQVLGDSAGFWHAVGSSMLNKLEASNTILNSAIESYSSSKSSTGLVDIYAQLTKSGAIKVLRVLAQIGDQILYSTGGETDLSISKNDGVKPFNVDLLVDGPQTRQSKSRSRDGQTESSLAWRNQSAPGMYILPRNVIKAVLQMNTYAAGGNPIKGHTTNSLLPKSFIDPNPGLKKDPNQKNRGRIPTDVARMMEDSLDSEYVPFYIHDLRTNEFIGFHAFLDSLTDNYSANYSTSQGYGRVDPVYIYKDTKRSIGFSFYIAATSKEDFDEMWFKINKLTTLVYPQWSKGTKLVDDMGNSFIQPFSQVIASTPLVRLRIGDVVKSNYSKFNLGRMFGIGDDEFAIADDTYGGGGLASGAGNLSELKLFGVSYQDIADFQLDFVFAAAYGSPMALLPLSGDAGATVADVMVRSVAATAMQALGGSALLNPIGAVAVMGELRNPDSIEVTIPPSSNPVLDFVDKAAQAASGFNLNAAGDESGYMKSFSFPYLKPSMNAGYRIKGSNNRIRTVAPYRVNVISKGREDRTSYKDANSASIVKGTNNPKKGPGKLFYEVKFFDLDAPKIKGTMIVFHEDLMPNPDAIFLGRVAPLLDAIGTVAAIAQVAVQETVGKATGIPAQALQVTTTDANEFMHPGNNPITRAFENSGGRGLAGVIRSLGYTWIDNQIPWETEWGSRAPKIAKVTVSFEPIHDLPPGIDHGGYNRAPNYNVGATMNSISGDPLPDEGFGSKAKYTRSATKGSQTTEDL